MRPDAMTVELFEPHPNLDDAVNDRIVRSEIEGGVHLADLAPGTVLEVETENRVYTIVQELSGDALICGHPSFCPRPSRVHIVGSTWGGSMLKQAYIGRGMHLEFRPPGSIAVTTSRIRDIRTVSAG